jgi:hypothetical protein
MVQQIWSKLNPRERQAAIGAGLIVLSWLLGIVLSSGLYGVAGAGGVGLLGAIAVLVVVYLRYAPNTTITWPAPYPTILLGISAVVALIAILQLLQLVSVLGLLAAYGGATVVLVLIVDWVGAALMLWGSYQEWQASKSAPAT